MKSFLTTIFFLSSILCFASNPPYVIRETANGGLFGYKYTERIQTSYTDANGNEHTKVQIHCDNPGFTHCPKSLVRLPETPMNFLSNAEIELSNNMLENAILNIESGILTGSNHQQIWVTQPDGIVIHCIITIHWQSDDNILSNSLITLTRNTI